MKNVNNQGLTLIDVIISIALLSIIMVSVISVTNQSVDKSEEIIKEDRQLLQIETALDRIDWDFSQIYTPMYFAQEYTIDPNNEVADKKKFESLKENPIYKNRSRFSMPDFFSHPIPIFTQETKDTFQFFTKAHRRRIQNSKESDFAWVKYEFRSYRGEDENKKGLYELVRYYFPGDIYNNDIQMDDIKPFVLAQSIVEYSISFWNDKKEKYELRLNNVENGDRLLRGFKVEIIWRRDNSEVEEYSSRTYRTVWPYFEPEDLNKLKYERINKPGTSITTQTKEGGTDQN